MSSPACSETIANRQLSPLTAAVLACFLLGGQVYLIAARGFANLLETPFLPYCLLGAFAIHMASRPGRVECFLTLSLGGLLAFGFVGLRPDFHWSWPNSLAAASASGLASLAVLSLQVVRQRGAGQQHKLNTLIGGSIFIYTSLFIAFILKWTAVWHPKTYDLYLYAADRGFGVPIAAWVGTFVARHATFSWWCELVYESLPLAVSLLYAYERGGSRPLAIRVLPAFLGGGAAAYLLYNILPAAGPHYIFGSQFPAHLPAAVPLDVQAPLMPSAPRNAVPSMHLACALLVFWNARRLSRWVYPATAAYLALTIAATLGFGEHYVVDLVAGVPYALFLGAACARIPAPQRLAPARNRALAVGAVLTLAWIAALRFTPFLFTGTAFTWIATLATVALCWAAQREFERAFARATRLPSSSPGLPPGLPLPPDPAWAAATAGSHYAAADTPLLP